MPAESFDDIGPINPRWDRAPHDAAMTAFKREARRRQATWRAAKRYAYGEHPKGQPNGSMLADEAGLAYKNFLSDKIESAVRHREQHPQKHQTFHGPRLRNNLLSSMPMCFNLFGELHQYTTRLSRTGSALWGVERAGVGIVFEWSPGRLDPSYTGDRTAFDVALFFGDRDLPQTVIGIETKYHEHATTEAPPRPHRMERYREITERAIGEYKVFKSDWEARIVGKPLQQIWRDHLLLLSMLQHDSGRWADGKYVLVYPRGNTAYAKLALDYADALDDPTTFTHATVEDLLDAHVLHEPNTEAEFRERGSAARTGDSWG
ncbi:PGN_0703 family putative restriction endonuclease [Nocardioides pelophilus]|uniref:PGN_0703 family putative restriction endonuclease n=1 Tax=Nocardioides pelophilus TaxID=2172019 RepID=UPI0016007364|nr:hypothetical protein [Nocardioides pelophilus]